MIKPLRRAYPSIHGTPVISHVDTEVFVRTFFTHCMQCSYCHDSCCAYGADIDEPNVGRLRAAAEALRGEVSFPPEAWFKKTYEEDAEYPGGRYTRTRSVEGGCVFLNRQGRGCLIHKYCYEKGLDYHDLKPLVCVLFPFSFADGVIFPAQEITDGSLVCLGPGPTLYRSVRDEIRYYFGDEMVRELDEIEAEVVGAPAPTVGTVSLPVLSGPIS
jgi:Fe-S-cluster containining protein